MPEKNLVEIMADAYALEKNEFVKTVKTSCFPRGQATDEQLFLFLSVARELQLNPFTREIYAFISEKTGQMQVIVPVDGWAKIINRHPAFDGMEFVDEHVGNNLNAITCRIYRKDRSHPTEATEYMTECKRGTNTWQQWPRRMLRHKAMIQGGRYAFGFAGIIDPDELERYYDVEIKAQRLADETVTLSLDAPVTQQELDESKRQFPDPLAGSTPAPVAGAGKGEHGSSPADARPPQPAIRRGRPPKNQEPQAPKKAAEVTPLSPAVAATVSPDLQPESSGSCPFCHAGNHSFNDCPANRVPEGVEESDAPNGAEPTLSESERADIEKMAKLLRPMSWTRWLPGVLQQTLGVSDLTEVPASQMKKVIAAMEANA